MFADLLEVFLISIVPISLMRFGIPSSKYRLLVLFGVFTLVAGILYSEGIPLRQLGIRVDNVLPAVIPYLVALIAGVAVLILLAKNAGNKNAKKWYEDPHFIFLFIPISFAQQFLFQGFMLLKLGSVFQTIPAVIVTALIFGYMHTMYPKPLLNMALGTLAGLLFATLYVLYPNLLLATALHSVLNFTAVYLGFFAFTDEDGVPKKMELRLF